MKKVLIVVDMQNDFITGSLGTDEAVAIIPMVRAKIEKYHSAGEQIIFTRDTHGEDYLSTPEGKKLPVEHCIKDTDGWQIEETLDVKSSDIIIDKPTFGYKGWREILQEDIEEIELIGLCTDICVVSNALILKAEYPNAVISIDAGCCAGVSVEAHNAALTVMASCQIERKDYV